MWKRQTIVPDANPLIHVIDGDRLGTPISPFQASVLLHRISKLRDEFVVKPGAARVEEVGVDIGASRGCFHSA